MCMSVKKTSRLFFVVGIACIIAAIVLLYKIRIEEYQEEQKNSQIVDNMVEIISESQEIKEDYLEIDSEKYIGIIEIPSIELVLPVQLICDENHLNNGICLYYHNINYVIAGHNRKSQFRDLRYVKEGDSLFFYDIFGNKKEYKLERIEDLDPFNIDSFIDSKYAFTLFTCTYDGQKRHTLRFN